MGDQDDQQYGWCSEAERQEAYAETERWQAQARFDETVAWAKDRQASREAADTVTKNVPPRMMRQHAEAAPSATASATARQWQRDIRRQIDRQQRITLHATAQVLKEERAAQRKINDELRDHVVRLERRIEALEQRGPARSLRAVGE